MCDLSLANNEEDEMLLDFSGESTQSSKIEMCLVGRFLTERSINFNIMRHRLTSIWKPGRGVSMKDLGDQRYMFQFFHTVDLKRVLEGGPWTFDSHLLILHQLKPGEIPNRVPLNFVDYWVQVYNLPVGCMSESIGKQLGNFVGYFLEYDASNNSLLWRNYTRIRVRIDVRVPLKRYKKIRLPGGGEDKVCFKYEKLCTFCFIYGLLGHMDRFCEQRFLILEGEIKKEWGIDLRASRRRGSGFGGERQPREGGGDEATWNPTGSDGSSSMVSMRAGVNNRIFHGNQMHKVMALTSKIREKSNVSSTKIQVVGQSSAVTNEDVGLDVLEDRKQRRGSETDEGQNKSMKVDESKQSKSVCAEEANVDGPKEPFLSVGSGFQARREP
ncbi:hypothetical protein PTKIN_Ptkin10aG0133100 [Pterospermum kingtungense]